jgi:uncharacterized oxidoreductase
MPTLTPAALETFARDILLRAGATAHEAQTVAASLVDSNLRGYDSHGVMRLPQYVQFLESKVVVPGTRVKILDEGESRIVADGQWAFGQVLMAELQTLATAKAKQSGLCLTTVHHAGHIGRLGEYCERAAADGLVTMLMVNSHGGVVRVAPPGGKAPRLSTNPLAIGVPHGDTPLSLDFSTSATAEGKVRVKKIAGEQVPEGWLLDSEGRPTTDPNLLYGNPPGSILPMGGTQGYKGFGLGLMVEILTGALSGGAVAGPTVYPKIGNCVFFLLIDPAKFGGAEHFQQQVEQVVSYIRDCPRVEGCEQITLPGDPERKIAAAKKANGIPLDAENWKALTALAERLGQVQIPTVQ